jgi:mono/diheme cytochrome c family protein
MEPRMHLQASARILWLPLAILMGVSAGASARADETLPGNAIQGAQLARELCALCHEVEKGDRGLSSAGAPSFQDVADDPAITAISLGVFFRSPHETMPDLILSQAETDNAIAYILSLK